MLVVSSALPDPRLDVPKPDRGVVARAFARTQGSDERSVAVEPSLDEVRASTESTVSALALQWLIERGSGCVAFIDEDNDGAVHASSLLDLLASMGTARRWRWSYWSLYGRWLNTRLFQKLERARALAHDLDAFVEAAVADGRADQPETDWAARLAIMTWELIAVRER